MHCWERDTAAIEAQLIAHNTSIFTAPVVVTHCAPVAMETHLYSALVFVLSTNQTNVSACTIGIYTFRSRADDSGILKVATVVGRVATVQ
jgi:hypothetical protein